MKFHILPTLLLTLLLTACSTTSNSTGDSSLMGLEDGPAKAVWADWSPSEKADVVPEMFVEQVVAFDYWQIESDETREQAWTGVSALLDYLRRESLSEGQADTATALLQALDSDQARMDVTYVVALDADRPAEGLVVRVFRELDDAGAVPAVAIYLERREDAGAGYEDAVMWSSAGFEEAEPFTLALGRADGAWSAQLIDGVAYPVSEPTDAPLDEAAQLAANIFERRFWQPFTGASFVEATPRAEDQRALPAPLEPALGLEVRDRQIEEVYRDTVFPPRMDTTPFEGGM